jgi:hypothetical protein
MGNVIASCSHDCEFESLPNRALLAHAGLANAVALPFPASPCLQMQPPVTACWFTAYEHHCFITSRIWVKIDVVKYSHSCTIIMGFEFSDCLPFMRGSDMRKA